MNYEHLFSERIGGSQFGKVTKTFKFTLIENAKREFVARNPHLPVIDMGVGEPEELAPDFVRETLSEAAARLENRLYPNNGGPVFRLAAARYLKRLIGKEFDPTSDLVHCIGTKSALAQIPLAFINPGDHVVATVPGYPVLPTIARWYGATVHELPLNAENRFLPDLGALEEIAKQCNPKLVLLNYPNNPTGAIATRSFFQEVIRLAHQYRFIIVQDAAYADLVHDGDFVSPLMLDGGRDVTLELYSLSKSYNMQGYRLGFVAGAPALVKAYALVKDNTDNGQFLAIQEAGAVALDRGADFLVAQREKYRRRLAAVRAVLESKGFDVSASPATFYLYVKTPEGLSGLRFESAAHCATVLTDRCGLVCVPWDEAGAYLRFSMTFEVGSEEFPDEARVVARMEERIQRIIAP